MGDVANDMMDEALRWQDEGQWCDRHQTAYLPKHGCMKCEDGDPPVTKRGPRPRRNGRRFRRIRQAEQSALAGREDEDSPHRGGVR